MLVAISDLLSFHSYTLVTTVTDKERIIISIVSYRKCSVYSGKCEVAATGFFYQS